MAPRLVFAETTDANGCACCDFGEEFYSLPARRRRQKLTLIAIKEVLQNPGVVRVTPLQTRQKFSGRGYRGKPHVEIAISFIAGFRNAARRSSSCADPEALPSLRWSANLER